MKPELEAQLALDSSDLDGAGLGLQGSSVPEIAESSLFNGMWNALGGEVNFGQRFGDDFGAEIGC